MHKLYFTYRARKKNIKENLFTKTKRGWEIINQGTVGRLFSVNIVLRVDFHGGKVERGRTTIQQGNALSIYGLTQYLRSLL